MAENFFTLQAEQSQVKTAIVSKYFWSWAKIMTGSLKKTAKDTRIAYIDLFAGPGRYKDGSKSTPLLILEKALEHPIFCESLVTIFNDKDPQNTSSLVEAIDNIDGVDKLKHEPLVETNAVGENIVGMFEDMNLVPTLFFVDPWGYKGLSLRLINSVLKDWGCECIFFFNYNRINMGLSNDAVKKHMIALFGEKRAEELRKKLEPLDPSDRELTIVEEICEALIEMGGKYVLPFRFRNNKETRTSHHLIFVSKHPLGYKIMKEVMANESSSAEQGVPSFEYSPASKLQPVLFDLARPLDDLEEMLLKDFAGRTLTTARIFEEHNYRLPYISKNYKEALLKLEMAGKITTDRPYTTRRKHKGQYTFADNVKVAFP